MKKYFLKFISLFIITAVISGCSNETATETEANETATETEANVTAETEIVSDEPAFSVENEQYGELISIYPYADVNPDYKKVIIDGKTMSRDYRGFGITLDSASSRLLIDYKEDNFSEYETLLEKLFGKETGFSHIKIVDSLPYDSFSINKNAAFSITADAFEINPYIVLELSSDNRNCIKTIEAAYDIYGLEFDYISFSDLSADIFAESVNRIKSENNARYDYSKIKFSVPESFSFAMLENAEIRNAADIIRLTGASAEAETSELSERFGKEIWYADSEAPSEITGLVTNVKGGGLSGSGNALDIFNRIINSFASGKSSLFEYGSTVAADYTPTGAFPKSLITAQSPWNGLFSINTGYWTSLHFTGFTENGWKFVESACYGDGTETNRSISETKNNYITIANPETGDFSVIIGNDSSMNRGYTFIVKNLEKADKLLHVWETSKNINDEFSYEDYNYGYMQLTDEFYAVEQTGDETESDENGLTVNESDALLPYAFSVILKPYSVMTVTTLDMYGIMPDIYSSDEFKDASPYDENFAEVLSLPWNDDYEYDEDFLKNRGNVPQYTQDMSGAFEVVSVPDAYGDENKALMQTAEQPEQPHYPVTIFGDNRWADYQLQADFLFAKDKAFYNFVQFGVRHSNPDYNEYSESGYSLKIYYDGFWEIRKNSTILMNGTVNLFDPSVWHTVKIEAVDNIITGFLDGIQIVTYKDDLNGFINSGRISLSSAFLNNCFDNVSVSETETGNPYIVRVDDRDCQITYNGLQGIEIISNFNYDYTLTDLKEGSSFDFWFYGSTIAFIGTAKDAKLKITVDGDILENELSAESEEINAVTARLSELDEGSHNITVEILNGEFKLNYVEYS